LKKIIISEKQEEISGFSHVLIRDHKEISRHIQKLRQKRKGLPNINLIDKLKWFIERHIYVEEKALFSLFDKDNISIDIDKILKDHDKILQVLEEIIKTKETLEMEKGEKLEELMTSHFDFEKQQLYEKIGNLLGQDKLDQFVSVINQPVELGFYPLKKLRNFHGY